jgi:ATP-dependent protease ClpP protease subunit
MNGSQMFLSFSSEINQTTTENFMDLIAKHFSNGVKEFNILLSTPGGSVSNGVTLYNYLRSIPANIIMHNIGVVDSIGNVIFLAADLRYAVPNSSFLFHGVGFNINQPTRFEEKQIKEKNKTIDRDQKLISDIIADRTNISTDKVRKMFLEAETKTPIEAKELGIINEIKAVEIPEKATVMQLVFQQRPWG